MPIYCKKLCELSKCRISSITGLASTIYQEKYTLNLLYKQKLLCVKSTLLCSFSKLPDFRVTFSKIYKKTFLDNYGLGECGYQMATD